MLSLNLLCCEEQVLCAFRFFSDLADRVLVLAEERLQFEAHGCGQGPDLGVGSYRHGGGLGQQTVE